MMSNKGDISDPETLKRHGASVRAIAVAILGDSSAADDVAQETFLTALRGGSGPVRDPGAWLRGVSRNLARRWIRTESRLRRREEARPVPAAPATPDETAARLETEAALTEAVRALPEPYRTVVVLRYFDGLTTVLAVGGVIMAKKILIATVFAAVLAAVFVAPALWEGAAPTPVPEGAPEELAGLPADLDPLADSAKGAEAVAGDAAVPDRPEEQFRVIVRTPDGSPAAGARIRFAGPDGVASSEVRTDGDGVALLFATGERGIVLVSPLGAAPVIQQAEAIADSEVEVVLPLGSVISGIFYLDDEPAANLEVHLNSLSGASLRLVAMTDERGAFRFTGLDAGVRYSMFAGWHINFVV